MKPKPFNKIAAENDRARIEVLLDAAVTLSGERVIYGQPKINGVFCSAAIIADKLVLSTKHGREWPMGFFGDEFERPLFEMISKFGPMEFLGELYAHSMPLAEFAGLVNVNKDEAADSILGRDVEWSYYIFDMIRADTAACNQPLRKRMQWLGRLNDEVMRHKVDHMFFPLLPTPLTTAEQAEWFYKQSTASYREGCIYRVPPMLPLPNTDIYKRKAIYDAEGTVLAVIEGQGKRKGKLGCFVVRTAEGKVFSLGGGAGLNDEMLEFYFKNPPVTRKITFTYEELSEYGIPLRPQFVAIRDYEE